MKNLGARWSEISFGLRLYFFFAAILALSSHASGATGQLTVNPSNVNFGSVSVGSSQTKSVTLANSGGSKLTITQATLSGTGFTLSGLSYPVTLAGGQSVTCNVAFTPPSPGTDSGSISIAFTTQGSNGKGHHGPISSSSTAVTLPVSGTGDTVSVTVSPTTASSQAGQQTQFTATVSGTTNTAVTWTASGGTITSGGQYTAPSSAGTYTVSATSVADPSKSASAVVTVSQPIQVSISVSPTTASLQTGGQQQFTAYVSGTSNTTVTWSASGGTVTSGGLYAAPNAAGTYTVTAVSAADPTKSASATVTVSAPQPISVTISPTTVAMPQKWQQQFAATVSGSSNTAVSWAVTQGTGTITQSGLYTAPQAVATDIVVATSQADSTKSASASITVVAPHSVALSWSPSSSSGISSYKVYRGTVSGGPYSLLTSGVSSTSYTDSNVQSGSTYYYVTTAVDSSGAESGYSNETQAVIPMP